MALHLYNVRTRKKEAFTPLKPGKAGLYLCGLTVYDHMHIGHARTAVSFEIIRNWLERSYDLTFVQNVTDVEDKILRRAAELERSPREHAAEWDRRAQAAVARLGCRAPDQTPHVTDSVPDIIGFIEGIIANDFAYATDAGNVYFDVAGYEEHAQRAYPSHHYGCLSRRDYRKMAAGTRKEVESDKRHPADFALWKAAEEGDHPDACWESPWGTGRPGWHIECSLMATRALGDTIDIHGGGQDLVFPHHENEIAQSQAKTGKAPFVRTWLHTGFLNVDGQKMSKSLGNFIVLEAFLDEMEQDGLDAEVLRFYFAQTHYRSKIDFSRSGLKEAARGLQRLHRARRLLQDAATGAPAGDDKADGQAHKATLELRKDFDAAMDDDIHTPEAIATLFAFLRRVNDDLENGRIGADTAGRALAVFESCAQVLTLFPDVGTDHEAAVVPNRLQDLARELGLELDGAADEAAAMNVVLHARQEARKAKDWSRADAIRDGLAEAGYVIEDAPHGPSVEPCMSGPSTRGTEQRRSREGTSEKEEGTYDRHFERWARWLLDHGVKPNHFTFLQIPVFVGEILAAYAGLRWTFVSLIALVIVLDGGDGILARVGRMQSKTGARLDASFDTLGIAIVVWGASRFFPEAELWLWLLFLGNMLLYVQNSVLERKVISYIRGPILSGVAFPPVMLAGLATATFIVLWELLARVPETFRAARKAGIV